MVWGRVQTTCKDEGGGGVFLTLIIAIKVGSILPKWFVNVPFGGIRKLVDKQGGGERGRSNVNYTTNVYLVNLSTKGEGFKNT